MIKRALLLLLILPLTGELAAQTFPVSFWKTTVASGTPTPSPTPTATPTPTPTATPTPTPSATPTPTPSSPSDIPGLVAWQRAESLGLSNNDPVSSWTDLSGTANHATQSSGTKQPIFKTAVLNGKAVVRFDGVNDLLEFTNELPNTATVMIVAAKKGSLPVQASLVLNSGSAGGGIILWARTNTTTNWGSFSTGFADVPSGEDLVTDVFKIMVLKTSPGGLSIYGNGTLKATAAQSYGGPGPKSTIGGQDDDTVFANIDVAELVVYDSLLSDSDRNAIEAYFAGEYGSF